MNSRGAGVSEFSFFINESQGSATQGMKMHKEKVKADVTFSAIWAMHFHVFHLQKKRKIFLLGRRLHNSVFKSAIVLVFFVKMNKPWRF